MGPTGSGKSFFAFQLAKKLRGEIISADSMQIYRGMDIGTDKPSRWARLGIRHHLLDIVSPREEFSVYEYRKRALAAIEGIDRRRKLPIIVGGTGLYIKAIVDGISPHPGKDDHLREELKREAEVRGLSALYERLLKEDPKVAKRIHPHDAKRIIRALEVLAISGKKLSEWEHATVSLDQLGYRYWIIGVRTKRDLLYEKINQRVDSMIRNGLMEEVKRLRKKKLSLTARQAIGYQELLSHLEGNCSFEEATEKMKQHTRNLAKRQIIWFKRDPRIRWVDSIGPEKLGEIVRMIQNSGINHG